MMLFVLIVGTMKMVICTDVVIILILVHLFTIRTLAVMHLLFKWQ